MSSIQNKRNCQKDSAQIRLDGHFSNAIVLRESIVVSILELKVVRKVLPHFTSLCPLWTFRGASALPVL